MLNNLWNLYKNNLQKKPLEDFTTEIFAGLLNMEKEIKDDFLYGFLHLPIDVYNINTQVKYRLESDDDCIIDIVIDGIDSICFIENKVNSHEGYRQLERYSKVLDEKIKENKKTYLFYCTKFHDEKTLDSHNFKQFQWFEIASLLKKHKHISFVNQFIKFLKKHDMDNELTFDAKDFISLCNLQNITNKIYDYLERVKPLFTKTFNVNQITNSFSLSQLKNHNRLVYLAKDILSESTGWSEIKYGFLLSKPEVYVGIWVDKSNKQHKQFVEQLTKYKNKFKVASLPQGTFIELKMDISAYLNNEKADKEIEEWFALAFEKFRIFINETRNELDWKIATHKLH